MIFETEYNKTIKGNKFVEDRIDYPSHKQKYFIFKRLLDILFSILAIFAFFIPSIILCVLIKLTSEGHVFYTQDRLGQFGKPFKIIKFRTMVKGAEEYGPKWADNNDIRVTGIGKFLRTTHLDEIPQFINVLKGDMSLVGPRPEREYFYMEFAKYIDGFDQRMLVPQGITGLAQVSGGYDLRPEEKIIYDLHYIKTLSLFQDLSILVRTFVQKGR